MKYIRLGGWLVLGTLGAWISVHAAEDRSSTVFLTATGDGLEMGVVHDFSTWSDLTAVFRPSRWRHPWRAGGSLSWLNYQAWRNEPVRTSKVLLGEVIVAGAAYAIYEATRSDGGGAGRSGRDEPMDLWAAQTPSPDSPSPGGGSGGDSSSGGGNADGGDGDSGGDGGGGEEGSGGDAPAGAEVPW